MDVYYNSSVTSYQRLLDLFWASHDPSSLKPRQYRSVIICHNQEQNKIAIESVQLEMKKRQRKLYTEVITSTLFYKAEEKHQKYKLRQWPSLIACLAWEENLATSYVGTRINGFVGGRGKMARFDKEWEALGMSKVIADFIKRIMREEL